MKIWWSACPKPHQLSLRSQVFYSAKSPRFQSWYFGFISNKKLVNNDFITAVYTLFADVHLNLEKPGKDWPMGNKWLMAESYSYKLRSWETITKVLTQNNQKIPRLLKIQIFGTKNGPIGQFWVAMPNKDLAIDRLSNDFFSLIQLLHIELVLRIILWIITAITCIRWFLSIVFP